MTVKDFITYLQQFPPEMEVLATRCSDFEPMTIEDWSVVRAEHRDLKKDWIMRSHPSFKGETKEYLHYAGN